MRLHIKLQSEKRPVPFNHQPQLTGAIHKWLGENSVHDAISMYSFSWLQGGRKQGDHLIFDSDTHFSLSAHDDGLIKSLIRGIQKDPDINFGLAVSVLMIAETPAFSNQEMFYVASPVLVKRKVDDREVHYTFDDPETDVLLTETLKTKLKTAGLSDEQVSVRFVNDYSGAKTKIIHYNRIGNRVNVCPVIIEGTPEQIAFAWNVGVGNSTGIGFGALK